MTAHESAIADQVREWVNQLIRVYSPAPLPTCWKSLILAIIFERQKGDAMRHDDVWDDLDRELRCLVRLRLAIDGTDGEPEEALRWRAADRSWEDSKALCNRLRDELRGAYSIDPRLLLSIRGLLLQLLETADGLLELGKDGAA